MPTWFLFCCKSNLLHLILVNAQFILLTRYIQLNQIIENGSLQMHWWALISKSGQRLNCFWKNYITNKLYHFMLSERVNHTNWAMQKQQIRFGMRFNISYFVVSILFMAAACDTIWTPCDWLDFVRMGGARRMLCWRKRQHMVRKMRYKRFYWRASGGWCGRIYLLK